MIKPGWEKEMEDYFNNMTKEEFDQFLVDTAYEHYKNVHWPSHVPGMEWLQALIKEKGEVHNGA